MIFEAMKEIPDKYKDPAEQKGTVEKFFYKTSNHREEEVEKYGYIYLPYGYDPAKKYDIVYQLHGGGEICDRALYKGSEPTYKKHFLDHMIANGDIKPVLFVSCEWNPYNADARKGAGTEVCRDFHNELVNELIPAVEAKYHGYSDFKTDKESLIAARDHRLLMGWSMGSVTMWFTVMTKDLAYFRNYNFESGDCWAVAEHAGDVADETAKVLHDTILANGFTKNDFNFYITTGTKDIAYPNLYPLTETLKDHPDLFDFSEEGNCVTHIWENGEHHTQWRRQYQYNAILNFFRQEKEETKA